MAWLEVTQQVFESGYLHDSGSCCAIETVDSTAIAGSSCDSDYAAVSDASATVGPKEALWRLYLLHSTYRHACSLTGRAETKAAGSKREQLKGHLG